MLANPTQPDSSKDEQARIRQYFAGRALFYDRLYRKQVGPLARFWWKPLRANQEHTLEALQDLRNKNVLEIGCGTGHLASAMAQRGATVVAIDLSPEMIDFARRTASRLGVAERVRFEEADFEQWEPTGTRHFDYIIAIAVLEYCQAPSRWLDRMSALGDQVIATFSTPFAPRVLLRRIHYAIRGGVPLRLYGRAKATQLFRSAGMAVQKMDVIGPDLWIHAVRASAR